MQFQIHQLVLPLPEQPVYINGYQYCERMFLWQISFCYSECFAYSECRIIQSGLWRCSPISLREVRQEVYSVVMEFPIFDPVSAGPGSHAITYQFTDANNCSNSATTNILVNVRQLRMQETIQWLPVRIRLPV